MSEREKPSALELLPGNKLEAVEFVLNYLTFKFGDLVLAALAAPIVIEHGETVTSSHEGYKDTLFTQIGHEVISAAETPALLEITLRNGTKIMIPLDAGFPPGPEMATLSSKGHFIEAWLRTGSSLSKQ